MEQLSILDSGFLEAEDSDRHVSLAVGGVSVIEGPMPEYDALAWDLAERILSVPRFRQVLHTHRLDLGAPAWVDVENLDLSHHVHRAGLPRPGDDAALFRFVADVMERRLDRERPLWECWIIEGLADDRWAILMKIHHRIADGIATMHMLAGMNDDGEGDTFVNKIRAAHEPSAQPPRLSKVSLNPLNWAGGAWHAATTVTSAAALAVEGAVEIVNSLSRPAAPSSLIGPVTTMRRYSAAQVALEDVAKVCDAFDVTVNDVALAAITDSFRAALIRRGEQPRRNSLRTLVPVSVRSNEAMERIRQPRVVDASVPSRRQGRSRRSATGGAHPIEAGESKRPASSGEQLHLGGERGALPPHSLGGTGVDAAPSTRRGHRGDERSGSPPTGARNGARGRADAAHSAYRPWASDGNRDPQLRR